MPLTKRVRDLGYFVDGGKGFVSIQYSSGAPCVAIGGFKPVYVAHEFAIYLDSNRVPTLQVCNGPEVKVCSLFELVSMLEKLGLPVKTAYDPGWNPDDLGPEEG